LQSNKSKEWNEEPQHRNEITGNAFSWKQNGRNNRKRSAEKSLLTSALVTPTTRTTTIIIIIVVVVTITDNYVYACKCFSVPEATPTR